MYVLGSVPSLSTIPSCHPSSDCHFCAASGGPHWLATHCQPPHDAALQPLWRLCAHALRGARLFCVERRAKQLAAGPAAGQYLCPHCRGLLLCALIYKSWRSTRAGIARAGAQLWSTVEHCGAASARQHPVARVLEWDPGVKFRAWDMTTIKCSVVVCCQVLKRDKLRRLHGGHHCIVYNPLAMWCWVMISNHCRSRHSHKQHKHRPVNFHRHTRLHTRMVCFKRCCDSGLYHARQGFIHACTILGVDHVGVDHVDHACQPGAGTQHYIHKLMLTRTDWICNDAWYIGMLCLRLRHQCGDVLLDVSPTVCESKVSTHVFSSNTCGQRRRCVLGWSICIP